MRILNRPLRGIMDILMARKRHTPDQTFGKLRDADVLLAQGEPIAEVARKLEVSEPLYYRWRNQFGGMKDEEMQRLKELEKEDAQLKRIVAEQALDNQILKDLAEVNF